MRDEDRKCKVTEEEKIRGDGRKGARCAHVDTRCIALAKGASRRENVKTEAEGSRKDKG